MLMMLLCLWLWSSASFKLCCWKALHAAETVARITTSSNTSHGDHETGCLNFMLSSAQLVSMLPDKRQTTNILAWMI